ncbi:MAG: response regulator [Vicinamibacterales bacterium]
MSHRSILIIDDNADDTELTRRALHLSFAAAEIMVMDDAVQALAWLTGAEPPEPLPALVLLDIKMPRMDGVEVVRRLRAHPQTCLLPVVLLTSSVEERDIMAGYAAGANAYVRKPITSERFTDAIRAVATFWLGHNELPTGAPPRDR